MSEKMMLLTLGSRGASSCFSICFNVSVVVSSWASNLEDDSAQLKFAKKINNKLRQWRN
jgi:hypothetical protein